ncbi:MAG: membrane protein insertase YidC [candidate division NC10 bacterium]|nr:membrane protein insertase YidC [candidate division NC10 bacterium]
MEKRALLASALALLILIAYQFFFAPPPPRPKAERAEEVPAAPPALVPEAARPAPPRPPVAVRKPEREERIRLETDLLEVTLTNQGGTVLSWRIKRYTDEAGQPLDLAPPHEPGEPPISLAAWVEGGRGPDQLLEVVARPSGSPGQPQTVLFRAAEPGGLILEKRLTLQPGKYQADIELRLLNRGAGATTPNLRVAWGPGFRGAAKPGAGPPGGQAIALVGGKRVTEDVTKLTEEAVHKGEISWVAVQDSYFAAALVPVGGTPAAVIWKGAGERPVAALRFAGTALPGGAERVQAVRFFGGPKEVERLSELGHDLEQLVDLGWFGFLARPALYLLKFLYRFTGNYGVVILLVTLLQKVAFLPLTLKSLKSMQAMQMLQPKVAAIRERHKNNRQKMNQETMELYKRHGVNPLGGCLPMVVQIPIFIALYNALSSSVELWRAPFILWIDDLSAPDTLFVLPFTVPFLGEGFPFRVLPLLMGASMFIQQKMTPTAGDPRQAQMMLYMMPTLFTFLFWGFPSGLVLYWLGSNVLQIAHQYYMNRFSQKSPAAEA